MPFVSWNWNLAGTDADRDAFNTMTAQLWTPEQVSLTDDTEDIQGLSDIERVTLSHVFFGLSTVESLQASSATNALSNDAERDRPGTSQAVLTAIAFGESIHTKAYFELIVALNDNTGETNNADIAKNNDSSQSSFAWTQQNEAMQEKLQLLNDVYTTGNQISANNDSGAANLPDLGALKRLAAAVLAQALLVESGFYLPTWLSSRGTMTKFADIIRLINRDIVTSSSYLGSVYQRGLEQLDDETRETMRQYVYDLANNLYFAEEDYSFTLPYADLGLDDDIEKFLSYNANKALSYLGYPALFPAEISQPNPAVTDELNDMESLASTLKPASLFGGSGLNFGSTASASAIGTSASSLLSPTSTGATAANKAEETSDDDWDF
ncbi:ribonucleotide-diphosphate reductase subunit beta [Bifidobacterium sp. ESL0690]|uniref:ribonucleotide-diphosphate reductase subunit beta n=1 Tax=Bifidobacterium sp. ESL0690 TaxID=2983214 RepID=UPI0023F687F9|nr:ribonucleotide-diphosphate reductase subunit beta [Bifidobacterium sp. ESL0690]WEV46858.1 ribonucleotide-diphosphate reductase subunit beta [Bifidobacterium sp. ESL0690]